MISASLVPTNCQVNKPVLAASVTLPDVHTWPHLFPYYQAKSITPAIVPVISLSPGVLLVKDGGQNQAQAHEIYLATLTAFSALQISELFACKTVRVPSQTARGMANHSPPFLK